MSLEADIQQLEPEFEREADPAAQQPEAGRRLRFLVCGSVDDGKSTLIGRLLWDTKSVAEDHRAALIAKGSKQNDLSLPDFGLLLDGLKAEQEQGITIDVAYRYFQTPRRAFIVADTPGHEQYTRNMATGASTADLAVLLVDARAGLLEQTRRHAAIVHLMGIRQVVLAVNKIDLVGYDRAVFDDIELEFRAYAARLGDMAITAIPLSALKGENIVSPARANLEWYSGPTLIEALEAAPAAKSSRLSFRMPIQRVSRPGESFRGYQGTVAAGAVAVGDRVVVAPSGQTVSVARIVTFDGDVPRAEAGAAVTLVFDRKVDTARGDVLTAADATPLAGRDFTATVVTLQPDGLKDGARLWLKAAGRMKRVRVAVDEAYVLAAGHWSKSSALPVNAIGRVRLRFDEEAIFDRFSDCRDTGAFILISPQTNNTVAGGMIADLAQAASDGQEQVTLALPRDLAEFVLGLPAVKARRAEIEVLPDR
ncbi:sulfate adenylyltransferase subunit 1 [Aliihoeflea sp. 40Bstr573]|uniref:sulfate adenylyltransferase subunit 1 n=1 Tax=Aliihoeflea sp. 40Bstr573 TaxID=2696467 RepID=UPI0020943273|nr:GTP-binding protein [Aliihoeflea sp. 40Bstr573]MCO6386851.1 sulfate adenylyltransferase subunit CysN [Aliihoeflea sp. 40Bstr573]